MTKHEIWEYWDRRAVTQPAAATTNDVWLRTLEVSAMHRAIEISQVQPKTILDIGCGDGKTTIALARLMPGVRFTGWDYSPNMIELARENAVIGDVKNVGFEVRDFTDARFVKYGIVLACRVFINIPNIEDQNAAFKIAMDLGSSLIAIENFKKQQENFETCRKDNGLPVIPVNDNNLYLDEEDLISSFSHSTVSNFANAYYYATRIVYALSCKRDGAKPDYNHSIHQSAVELSEICTPDIAPMRIICA